MSNENHNSIHNWKSKLEELQSLAGETMPDKNAAWEKIHARLEGKRPAKKPVWYWLAAASVVFLLMVTIFISNKNSEQMPGTASKQIQPETKQKLTEENVPAKTENHHKDLFTAENPALPKKSIPVIFDKRKHNETAQKNTAKSSKDELRLYDSANAQDQTTVTINNPLPATDTASRIASVMPVKKRLPVVQINELGDPDDLPQVAHSSEKSSVPFLRLGSGEVYKSPASITKNFATINFKTSPN